MGRATKVPKSSRRDDPTPWITVRQAADHLGVGVDAIYEACARKGLRHAKVGRSTLRLRRDWLDDWLEARSVENSR